MAGSRDAKICGHSPTSGSENAPAPPVTTTTQRSVTGSLNPEESESDFAAGGGIAALTWRSVREAAGGDLPCQAGMGGAHHVDGVSRTRRSRSANRKGRVYLFGIRRGL
jgi:hypothetical protein